MALGCIILSTLRFFRLQVCSFLIVFSSLGTCIHFIDLCLEGSIVSGPKAKSLHEVMPLSCLDLNANLDWNKQTYSECSWLALLPLLESKTGAQLTWPVYLMNIMSKLRMHILASLKYGSQGKKEKKAGPMTYNYN